MKTRVGIVGCGNISDIYIENARRFDNYEIVACADALPERAGEKARQHGIPRALPVNELLASPEVEIVLNLTTPQAHAEIDVAALAAGKGVYSEKPLAVNFADGRRVLELAKAKGLSVGCAPDTFLGGRLQTARALLDSGAIGQPVAGFVSMTCHGHESWHPGPEFYYKKGAGPLFDMGPYYLTALVSLLGPARRVTGLTRLSFPTRTITSAPSTGTLIEVEVPTHVSGSLEFVSGCIVNLLVSFDVWDSNLPRFELYGSQGSLSILDADPLAGPNIFGGDLFLRPAAEADWNGFPSSLPRKEAPTDWRRIAPSFPYAGNSRGVGLADMVDAVRRGRRPRADVSMACHVLEIMENLIESARLGCALDIATACERPEPLPGDAEEFVFSRGAAQ